MLATTTETGASPITAYEVWQAASPFVLVATLPASQTQYTATALTGGATYRYKIRAENLHGHGPFSAELYALAAQVPDAPAAPTTTQVATGVQVSWTEPPDQHQPITAYTV